MTVVRSGGLAGLRAEWTAGADGADPSAQQRWASLIESCPWDSPSPDTAGADRYVWRIDAHCGGHARTAQLPDHAVAGPWRTLVDEVRQAAAR